MCRSCRWSPFGPDAFPLLCSYNRERRPRSRHRRLPLRARYRNRLTRCRRRSCGRPLPRHCLRDPDCRIRRGPPGRHRPRQQRTPVRRSFSSHFQVSCRISFQFRRVCLTRFWVRQAPGSAGPRRGTRRGAMPPRAGWHPTGLVAEATAIEPIPASASTCPPQGKRCQSIFWNVEAECGVPGNARRRWAGSGERWERRNRSRRGRRSTAEYAEHAEDGPFLPQPPKGGVKTTPLLKECVRLREGWGKRKAGARSPLVPWCHSQTRAGRPRLRQY
jgi:hypothetical protein